MLSAVCACVFPRHTDFTYSLVRLGGQSNLSFYLFMSCKGSCDVFFEYFRLLHSFHHVCSNICLINDNAYAVILQVS